MSRWLNLEEMVAVTGWSARTLQRKARDGSLKTRQLKSGFPGRPVRKYLSDSLPFDSRMKLKQEWAPGKESALTLSGDERPQPILPGAALTQSLVKVAFATPEQEAQARERYTIIEPLIRFKADQRSAPHGQLHLDLGLVLPDGNPVITRTQLCLYLANKHRRSEATIWRLISRFNSHGLLGLADRARKDKGKSRFFEKHPKAAALAAYLYLVQRQSVRAAYEAIQRDCLSLRLKPQEVPTYETVRAFLNSAAFSEPLKLLARKGRRFYREQCAPYISRGYTDVTSNEIWVSDHMISDVEVQNDYFFEAKWGTPIRLRFTAILDFHSRFVVGCSWAWEGSSRSIGTALRQAVSTHGPAEVFYCDNGKDYLKVGRGAVPAYLRETGPTEWYEQELRGIEELGVLARLGMAVQHCIVRHPQSKHVERFFGTMHGRFDKKFPTYTGGSPAMRPDFAAEAMADHRKRLRIGKPGTSLHPPASVFIRLALAWLEDYHNTPHRGKAMNGRTPRQAFDEDRNPRQKPAPAPDVLAMMLAERERRAVRECSIMLNKHRYIGDDDISAGMLHEQNGREVVVAYDPLDLEKVAILDAEGRLIAWAKQEHYVTQSAEANEEIAASMRQRRRMEKRTAATICGIAASARAGVGTVDEVTTQRPVRFRPKADPMPELLAWDIADLLLKDDGAAAPQSAPWQHSEAPLSAVEIARRFVEED